MYAHVCAVYKCTRTHGHMHVCAHTCRHTAFPTEKVTSAHKPPLAIPGLFSISTWAFLRRLPCLGPLGSNPGPLSTPLMPQPSLACSQERHT